MTTDSASSDGYARHDWWGDGTETDTTTTQPGDRGARDFATTRDAGSAHEFTEGTHKAEWLAHKILKESGTLICARTLLDDPYAPRSAVLIGWLEGAPTDAVTGDPGALHDQRGEVALTEPVVRLPAQASDGSRAVVAAANGRHRARVNDASGYIAGEGTGALIQDRPAGEFMDVIEDLLARAAFELGASASERRALRERARRLKRSGEWRDVDIVEAILDDLLEPTD